MAERATSFREIRLHKFTFVPTHEYAKIKKVEVSLPCTEQQVRQILQTPVEIFQKNAYITFSNSAYEVRVSGTEWKQVAQTFLERLLLAVRQDRYITTDVGAEISEIA